MVIEKQPIPVEELATTLLPGMKFPHTFTFSQDDKTLMYLFSGEGNSQQVYGLDIESGKTEVLIAPPGGGVTEDNLSPEEILRRQRQRMLAVGITQYKYAAKANHTMIPLIDDVYLFEAGTLRKVVDCDGQPPALNATMTADGTKIAYVQDAEIFVTPVNGGEAKQVTTGARGTGKTNGLAEFIAQEELGRLEGFWWSPDAQQIAYTEVDETHIPVYRIMHQGKEVTGDSAQEDHRYPFAGKENATVRLAVTAIDGGKPVWMNLDYDEEIYIARVFWWDNNRLGAEILNREQSMLDLVTFNIATGKRTIVLRETSDYWINTRVRHFVQLNDGGFVWASERSGFNHLYLYAADGSLSQQLTSGDWMVDGVAAVDEKNQLVYFNGNREHPTERHLYVVAMTGGAVRRITPEAGMHITTIDRKKQHFVNFYSAIDQPPTATIRALSDGSVLRTIHESSDSRLELFDLQPPEMVSLPNRDGTTLYGAIYRPPERFGPGPYPTVVHVYGGPGPQMVVNNWVMTANLTLQYLREQGFLVFRVDNRGSARRGLAFEGALKHKMGTVEVDDQVDGVKWLVEQGLADPERVGVHGWSYGGFMTLMCLAKAADVFKMGVCGAPVTAWDGYDTCYTERYMSTPQANPDGYAEGNVMNHVENIEGKFLLIHGMLDENVHFRHTARLINALMKARKDYDFLPFPDERHMPRHQAGRIYLYEHIVGYFKTHL
jgi:dipeptidyl-peptidase 4